MLKCEFFKLKMCSFCEKQQALLSLFSCTESKVWTTCFLVKMVDHKNVRLCLCVFYSYKYIDSLSNRQLHLYVHF